MRLTCVSHVSTSRTRVHVSYTCRRGREDIVDALIDCGADVNYLSERASPLTTALVCDEQAIVAKLLYAGASTSLAHPTHGGTPVSAVFTEGSECSRATYQSLVCYRLTGFLPTALQRRASSVVARGGVDPNLERGVRPHILVERELSPAQAATPLCPPPKLSHAH